MRFGLITVGLLALTLSIVAAGQDEGQTANPVPTKAKNVSADAIDFVNDVAPQLTRLGCNQVACHGSNQGKGGFRLSMFAGDSQYDFRSAHPVGQGEANQPCRAAKEPLHTESLGRHRAWRRQGRAEGRARLSAV